MQDARRGGAQRQVDADDRHQIVLQLLPHRPQHDDRAAPLAELVCCTHQIAQAQIAVRKKKIEEHEDGARGNKLRRAWRPASGR
ncbi:MAG: hypothetical protein M5R42_19885 [Rhodocyclaceae bacterium]|nr:hypothetical protein [Rhodocyclaceae bacterium]